MGSRVFLTNTDTTIGFISKSSKALDIAKNRTPNKKYITALSSLKKLKKRTPKKFNKLIRRAKKTTFILNKNFSFRVIKDKRHLLLINRLDGTYTTSANKSGYKFNYEYATSMANIIVYPLKESKRVSTIYKISKTQIKRLR